jgi:predicted TIM-barrel fold metal-dependent hydrolase
VIGVENIMVESDYPHADSTWRDTQSVVAASMGHLPDEELRVIATGNAVRLFGHPLPDRDDWRRP